MAGRYRERAPKIKQRANNVWAKWTRHFTRKHLTHRHHFFVIDDCNARSTRTLLARGVTANQITAFTCNRNDYNMMPALGVRRQCAWASDVYRDVQHDHVVVWHDGQQIGSNTLTEIKHLIRRRCKSIGLVANMCARGNKSHRTFVKDLRAYAISKGYYVNAHVPEHKYRQHRKYGVAMWSFWFEMELIESIDLS